MNKISTYFNARQNVDILSGTVRNGIFTRSWKTVGKGVEIVDNPDGKENDDQTNVKRKRSNDYELKPNKLLFKMRR